MADGYRGCAPFTRCICFSYFFFRHNGTKAFRLRRLCCCNKELIQQMHAHAKLERKPSSVAAGSARPSSFNRLTNFGEFERKPAADIFHTMFCIYAEWILTVSFIECNNRVIRPPSFEFPARNPSVTSIRFNRYIASHLSFTHNEITNILSHPPYYICIHVKSSADIITLSMASVFFALCPCCLPWQFAVRSNLKHSNNS